MIHKKEGNNDGYFQFQNAETDNKREKFHSIWILQFQSLSITASEETT